MNLPIAYVICDDCGYAKPIGEDCPNPACWPGYGKWLMAYCEWLDRRDNYVTERTKGHYVQKAAFREFFDRDNPPPTREMYEHD